LAFFEARLESNPNDTAAVGQSVGLLLDRAQLSGDYADYARAQAHLDAAFTKQTAAAAGPHPAAVSLDLALHRYDAAEARIPFLRSSAESQAALDFERGNYEAAGEVIERLAKSNQPVHLSRLAIYKWKTGDFDEAERLLDEAESRYHGRFHRPEAWYHLHRGIFDLERGRLDDALVHYEAASEKLAGYWLIDEHVAEIRLLKGELDEANRLYTDLVARTGNPEFMDALAETLEQQGKPDEAKAMVARARAAYDERLKQFPEATWGHALDHWLRWEDPAEALEMAEKNHKNRPNGDAKLALARALAKVGRVDEARKVVAEVQASPFNTPEVAELAAELKAR
jgi:tetratricopeptide (TPR) repeat protein